MVTVGVKDQLSSGLRSAAQKLSDFGSRAKSIGGAAGSAVEQIGGRMQAGMASIGAGFERVGLRIGLIGAGLTAASASILTPMRAMVTEFAAAGDAVHKFGARTGMSSEAITQLSHAAGLSGTDMKTFELGVRKMQDTLANATAGNATAQRAFSRLGVDFQQLSKLTPDKQFVALADAIKQIQDPSLKTAAAMDVFGRAGTMLLPMLNEGSAGLAKIAAEADTLGITMSQEAANDAAALTDAMGRMNLSVTGLRQKIAEALAPSMTYIVERIAKTIGAVTKFIRENKAVVKAVAIAAIAVGVLGAALTATGTVVAATGAILISLSAIGAFLAPVFAAIGSAVSFMISPFGLAIAAVVALAGAFLYFSGYGKKLVTFFYTQLSAAVAFTRKVFGGIYDAIMAGDLQLAIAIAWAGAKVAWLTGVAAIQSAWDAFTGYLWSTFGTIGGFFESVGKKVWDMASYVMETVFPLAGVLIRAFTDAVGPIIDSIGIIGNAIAKGEFAAAGEIAMLSLKMAWVAGINGLQLAWAEFTTWLSGGWDALVTGLQSIWGGLVSFFTQGLLAMLNGIYELATAAASIDPTGAAQAIADTIGGNIGEIRKTAAEDAARYEEGLQTGLAERQKRRQKSIDDMRAKGAEGLVDLERQRAAIVERIGAGEGLTLESAKQELDDLIARAQAARDQAAAAAQARGTEGLGGVEQALGGAADRGRSATTAGTFARGTAAFQALAAGGVNKQQATLDALAKAGRETANNTASMLAEMTRKSPGEIDEPEAALAFSQ